MWIFNLIVDVSIKTVFFSCNPYSWQVMVENFVTRPGTFQRIQPDMLEL